MATRKKKRVAIYARVSTSDKDQNPETQLLPLRAYIEQRKWDLVDTYIDEESGRQEKREKRQQFKRLLDDAHKRNFDVLLVFRYSRFARSTKDLVDALSDFEALGIDFVSYSENIDTTTSHGKFFYTVIAAFAQLESDTIRENVKAGLARARQEGKRLGRPPVSTYAKETIINTWKAQQSIRKTAKVLDKAYSTVHKVVTAYQQEHPDEKFVQLEFYVRVENNNKFVRGKGRSQQEIEHYLSHYFQMHKAEDNDYTYYLTLNYSSEEELENIIYRDLYGEASSIADMRHGHIDADIREIGGLERSWWA